MTSKLTAVWCVTAVAVNASPVLPTVHSVLLINICKTTSAKQTRAVLVTFWISRGPFSNVLLVPRIALRATVPPVCLANKITF